MGILHPLHIFSCQKTSCQSGTHLFSTLSLYSENIILSTLYCIVTIITLLQSNKPKTAVPYSLLAHDFYVCILLHFSYILILQEMNTLWNKLNSFIRTSCSSYKFFLTYYFHEILN